MPSHPAAAPPILHHAEALLARYDLLLCDVWGVVHNGITAYAGAVDSLKWFRAQGGTVILVSNAPVPKHRVAAMLSSRHVPHEAYDDIVSSGDLALNHVAEQSYERVYCIGPLDRDQALFSALKARSVDLDDAQAIVCTGLTDDRNERPEDYLPLLHRARKRNIPFVCANPDLVVDVGGTLLYCAGAIADLYQSISGEVVWTGKPYPIAYQTAADKAEVLRGATVAKDKMLVIGDAVRTDLKGAENFGCDALFIASGIHRHETMDGRNLSASKLEKLFSPADTPGAIAAMAELRL
jgi:HAD superfamily hydrolase (TIGR01459 family)